MLCVGATSATHPGGASLLPCPCRSGARGARVAKLCARAVLAHLTRVFQGKQEENDVVEKLNLFLDLLQSYKVSLAAACSGTEP